MPQEVVIDLAQQAFMVLIFVSAPLLGIGLIVGLAISIFQATTQIQEQTLSFVPKVAAVLGALIIFGPWMLSKVVDYTTNLFTNINMYIR